MRRYLRDRTAARFAFGETPAVLVQVLRIGDALLLGLPLEPTVDVGLDWKRRAPAPHAALIAIANGWMRYLPHPRNFEEPDAETKYEILQSTLVADAAERLLAARRGPRREPRGVSRERIADAAAPPRRRAARWRCAAGCAARATGRSSPSSS